MNRQRGFTLLEMLVAVALLAMLGVAAALTLNSTLRSDRQLTSAQRELSDLQRGQRWLRRDLEQMVARTGRDLLGEVRTQTLLQGDPGDSEGLVLDFYRTGQRMLSQQPPSSHLLRVRYRLQEGELWREVNSLVDSADNTRWARMRLFDKLEGVALRYFHQDRWFDQWPPLNSDADGVASTLPQAIEVVLTLPRWGAMPLRVLLAGPGE